MRPAAKLIVMRVGVSVAALCVVHAAIGDRWRDGLVSWAERLGKAAGCRPVFESGVMARGPGGPFAGDDFTTVLFNYVVTWGPWWAAALAGFAAAASVYGVCLRLERTRVLGYRGETRCGGCGYGLEGLKEARCPECGRGI